MDLYTLNTAFGKNVVIDEFTSVVWTERYSTSGDVNLVVEATPQSIVDLKEGTFLACEGTEEVMIIDTQSIENGLLTVTGYSLLEFLNQRVVISSGTDWRTKSWYIQNKRPGELIAYILTQMAIIVDFPGHIIPDDKGINSHLAAIGGIVNRIDNLSLGNVDATGAYINAAVPHGPLLDALKTIADTYSLGMNIHLFSGFSFTASLKFNVYKGIDRTDPVNGPVVRFSPIMDSLTKVKELRSIQAYKIAAYVYATSEPSIYADTPGIAYAYPGAELLIGFDRRVLLILADDITIEKIAVNPAAITPADVDNFWATLNQRARDALANNNYIKVLDGEIVPNNQFQYGVHYGLGDIVQLQGYSELIQKARITEYIRTQDSTGERAYPTVSVIE